MTPVLPAQIPVIPREGGGSTTSFLPFVMPAKAGIHDYFLPTRHAP
jgi:hypothetical protein